DFWDHALQQGGFEVEETVASGSLTDRGDLAACAAAILAERTAEKGLQIGLYEKAGPRDGRHANNPWLQELPDPVTRITWGNYVSVAPALAAERGLEDGDVVGLRGTACSLELPVQIQPGQPLGAVSIALGYGRT